MDFEANSMFGGAADIFQQPVIPAAATLPPPSSLAMAPGVPPIPASGLPEGWTMEQWQYYGQQYLQQQNQF
jgi:hypothetical protein